MNQGLMVFDPFVIVGFALSEDGITEKDVSSWEGICMTYESSANVTLEIGLDERLEATVYTYALPFASLPKTISERQTVDISWSDFKEPGWGAEHISGTEAVKKATKIRFKIQAKTGTSGDFAIYTIGRLGTCGQ